MSFVLVKVIVLPVVRRVALIASSTFLRSLILISGGMSSSIFSLILVLFTRDLICRGKPVVSHSFSASRIMCVLLSSKSPPSSNHGKRQSYHTLTS